MGPYRFAACVNIDVKHGSSNARANSGANALRCVKCLHPNNLEVCKNCENPVYSFGIDQDRVIGLYCSKCKQGFTSWKCVCGTDNPVSSITLLAKDNSGGCFIATAACGAVDSPEVLYLSAFRDDVLQKSTTGRIFIMLYYLVSPSLARFVSRFMILQSFTIIAVIRPIIFVISFIRKLSL